MSDFEDYQVHREGLADAAEPDTWTRGPRPIPLVLTIDGEPAIQADNPDTPVPYELTPEGVRAALPGTLTPESEAAAAAWSGIQWPAQPEAAEPDTWTRAPVAYVFTRGSEVVAAGFVAREPEAGS